MNNYSYIITIEPNDPRYKQVIRAALKAKDANALSVLKGNTHKPIWFVRNWFMYSLMASSWDNSPEERAHVVIYHPQARLDFIRSERHRKGQDTHDLALPIPLDTYSFLG
ncbi:hypothetical protein GCM10028805_54280 [Spirosoma harenae]